MRCGTLRIPYRSRSPHFPPLSSRVPSLQRTFLFHAPLCANQRVWYAQTEQSATAARAYDEPQLPITAHAARRHAVSRQS
jgi:hypothetical protein